MAANAPPPVAPLKFIAGAAEMLPGPKSTSKMDPPLPDAELELNDESSEMFMFPEPVDMTICPPPVLPLVDM